MNKKTTEVAIIGAGPGGLSAALWCDELGLNPTIYEAAAEAGGQLLWTHNAIENYLGFNAADGKEMRDRFLDQLRDRDMKIRFDSRIASFEPGSMTLRLEDGSSVRAGAAVIATGVSRRVPDAKGFLEFKGKGVLESGKKEFESARAKRAVVVGGGDAAFENALILSEPAEHVTLIHRSGEFRARPEFIDAVRASEKISIITDARVAALAGAEVLESVEIRYLNTDTANSIDAEVIVFRIGVEPNSAVFREFLETDDGGYIRTDAFCRTSVEGIYAVGDVANPVSPTISTAAGMGATAAKSIFSWSNESSDVQSPQSFPSN